MKKVYLDYNATTPLELEVQESISYALQHAWGNPSSSHEAGKAAKCIIDKAREDVATMIGAAPQEIIFTSGGTEADNMIILSAVDYFNSDVNKQTENGSNDAYGSGDRKGRQLPHIISSHMEHPAVNVLLDHLEKMGKAEITYAHLSHKTGCLDVEAVLAAVQSNTILVTVMLANNETGLIQPVKQICERVHSLSRGKHETPRILVHTDVAQAIGKIPVNVTDLEVDYLTIVGHKFYGPRNGAVYARSLYNNMTPLYPMLFGGGQERDFRPGTENTGMIAGLGKASELVTRNLDTYQRHMQETRDYLEQRLLETFPDAICYNGKLADSERLPNTCNFSIKGPNLQGHKVLSECMVLQASVGAACHAQNRPSPILLAIGVPEEIAQNALRLSIGRHTTKQDIDAVILDLETAVQNLKTVKS